MWEAIVAILNLIAGPTGTVIVLALVVAALIFGGYKVVDKVIIPAVKTWWDTEQKKFQDIMNAHEEDRKVFKDSIEVLTEKIQQTDDKVDKLSKDVEEVKNEVKKRRTPEEGNVISNH